MRLAIDAMGGDFGPRVTVPAALSFLKRHRQAELTLFGIQSSIQETLDTPSFQRELRKVSSRLHVIDCQQLVEPGEKPSIALRRKRDSSMWKAVEAVASGSADACVSAGNTGALMAMGMAQLGVFEGVERPAICTNIPARDRPVFLLDVGANLECSNQQLYQFAVMGSAMASAMRGIQNPELGLLNVGEEEQKGSQSLRQLAELLRSDSSLNYSGFVEGDDVWLGKADVVVCDGFNGNVALKAGEGVARLVAGKLKQGLEGSLAGRLGAMMFGGILRSLYKSMDPATYNGASLLGLKGLLVKSHGSANAKSFEAALDVALMEANCRLPELIEKSLNFQRTQLRSE